MPSGPLIRPRARRARTAIDAEHFATAEFTKAHHLAGQRVDGDPGFSRDDEEQLIGRVEIVEDRFSRPKALPDTMLLDALKCLSESRRSEKHIEAG